MKDFAIKYFEGRATKAEQTKLLKWLRHKKNRPDFRAYRAEWIQGLEEDKFPGNSEQSWNNFQSRMLEESFRQWKAKSRTNRLLRIASVFFFLLSVGSLFYFLTNTNTTASDFFTHVMAENGHISKVQLPDGSIVWLNSGSEISYNNSFAANNRNISLKGEAYFQASKNEQIPLVVSSDDYRVKVLGTKFNMSAYPEKTSIDVTLESGEVELLTTHNELFRYRLNPGERAVINKQNQQVAVNNVNTSKFTSWKDGIINIYDQTLEELVERLETRYNQQFIVHDDAKKLKYTFTIKNESLDEIIHLMQKITPLSAAQKNDTIVLKRDLDKREWPARK